MSESIFQQVLNALNLVVLSRLNPEFFQISSTVPDWYKTFFPELADSRSASEPLMDQPAQQTVSQTIQKRSHLGNVFPFLEHFLEDAEVFWQSGTPGVLKSGFWSETNAEGREYQFEATAMCAEPYPILLLAFANAAYVEKQTLLQAGRANELSYGQLAKEIEKKEILLHCIFHDLAGQLITFRFCLELLKRENLSERGRDRLETGIRQVQQQEELMREIIQAFSAEIAAPQAVITDKAQAPNLITCVQNVVSAFLPAFTLQNKQLQIQSELDPIHCWQFIGEQSRLERVLANLLENALRHTPEHSTVTLTLQEEDQFLCCTIADQGAGVPSESVKYLFQRFFQGKTQVGKAGLGLYFCRVTVEQWGGSIGYTPTPAGGAQFWLRLRKLL